MKTAGEVIIGYGDTECDENCPARRGNIAGCTLMVQCTISQMLDAMIGDNASAEAYERKQNLLAIDLGCEPGRRRV